MNYGKIRKAIYATLGALSVWVAATFADGKVEAVEYSGLILVAATGLATWDAKNDDGTDGL